MRRLPDERALASGSARLWDRTFGGPRALRHFMRHIFPDHWSFFLGEIALYCFIVLIATGTYLALFFHPSLADTVYQGSYAPLRGTHMSDAYRSVLQLSFDVRAGLIVRQIHHWAALLFAAALTLHVSRMFFTGAYRRPRRLNYLIGLSLLLLVLLNGFTGYSIVDDLISGIGLRIAFSITQSIPLVGPQLAFLLWGGAFPSTAFVPRIYPLHIFLVPLLIAGLLGAHLTILWRQRHTEFPGRGRDDRTVVGTRLIPAYALRTTGYLMFVAGLLAAMGSFFQINPIWLYGPYNPANSTVAAQPDWYTGWLEGALRLFPAWDIHIGGFMLPAIFWPAVVFPGVIFGLLFSWPWVDAYLTGDRGFHNVLEPPRSRPARTAFGASVLTALFVLLLAGGDDVFASALGMSVRTLVWVTRVLFFVLPAVVLVVTYLICRRLPPVRGGEPTASPPAPSPAAAGSSD